MKRIDWDGNDLFFNQMFALSYKIDGVCCIINREKGYCESRNGKKLMHTSDIYTKYKDTNISYGEIYLGDFKSTISSIKTIKGTEISPTYFFPLNPIAEIHNELLIDIFPNGYWPKEGIKETLQKAVDRGYEGLVIQSFNGDLIKIKPKPTYDEQILMIIEGSKKNKGKLGAFLTQKGKVGTGFTDEEREKYFTGKMVGKTIEVECMGLTTRGKFRHPRFVRLRPDKDS